VRFPALCVNGIRTASSVVEAPGGYCRVLGIRLTALGACVVLGQPMSELVDVTVDLQACLGVLGRELGERCEAAMAGRLSRASAARASVDAAVEWTAARAGRERALDPVVAWSAARIGEAYGSISLEGLRGDMGLSRLQLAQRFRRALGVTPKLYARILRFHRALELLTSENMLSSVAHDLGYFDQSHMYRDFREFADMTPAAFAAAQRYPQSTHLAES
jgi:transcriptional regulator GlxA family with amidase domain